ncbi:MAG: hypothetical protein Q4D16_21620 [Eubacteriales bacterium]|nr:hypothetical protein [Eubacteriales bacterium]
MTGEDKVVKDLTEVWINTPELQIDKTADKYEWRVGDDVQYRVVVTNSMPGTVARNVTVSDLELPQGLILSNGTGSVEIIGAPQQVDYPVPDHKTGQITEIRQTDTSLEGNEQGFAFYCSYLPYSYPVTIVFHCTALETCNGLENVNVASVQAENAREKSDDAEVYINTGSFWIDKTADHYEWQLGELVEYQVVVENQAPGTVARNVTIWDTDMPQGLALYGEDSVNISGIPEVIHDPVAGTPDIPSQLNPEAYGETQEKQVSYQFLPEGSGWRLNISDLPAGMPVTITFLCSVTEEVNGMESINAAYVQAENAPVQSDDAEIYVNTAVLSIDKSINNRYLEAGDGREAYEFRIGEQVEYQVTVNNLQKGSIARNLVISDLSLPQGLAVDNTEDALAAYGIPVTILNPVAGTDDQGNQLNPENYNEVEEKVVEYYLYRQETGWILTISDLPYNTPVTIVFRCTVQEELNGWEIVNTAKAYAGNAAEVKDTSKIWVNSPVLKVEKKADKPFYKYGDIATYRIKITQEQIGCVARNVTVADMIETPGVRLLKDSMVLLDQDGNLTDAGVEANDDNTFTVYTGRALVKDGEYWIYDGEQGGGFQQVLYNPLDCKAEKQMIVEYQAAIIDENLAGLTVRNIAIADSQEHYPVEDSEEVEIHSPILDVVKESDQKEYYVGEEGYYKLTVRQLREDVHAENIVIEDALNHQGAVIQKGSILIRKNGQLLENAILEASEGGFRIVTGTDLYDYDKIEVFYKVLFESPALDGAAVINTARAKGDNTPEAMGENEVYVGDIRPTLVIDKSSDKEMYEPGDTGHYQVKITQTERNAKARNVVIRDVLKDSQAVLIKDSVKLYDQKGVELDKPEIEGAADGYTIHTGMELAYQEFLIVKYDVKFPENIQEKEVTNVAMATSDNMKPAEEKIPEGVMAGDGIYALKTAQPPSGSIVEENGLITYSVMVENRSNEIRKNIMVKDAIPDHTSFEKFGDREGELIELDGKDYAAFWVDEIQPGETETLTFTVKRGKAGKDECFVNLAQVRATIANKEDITEETWKSSRFFNTNATVHYGDTLWVRDEHIVKVAEITPSTTPAPTEKPKPSITPSVTESPGKTPAPTKTPTAQASPTPTAGTCPQNTKIPTKFPSGGSPGGSTGGGNYTPGNGGSYGNYSGGSMASNAKTGDTRPFQAMARAGLLGLLLLVCGVWIYHKAKKGDKNEKK